MSYQSKSCTFQNIAASIVVLFAFVKSGNAEIGPCDIYASGNTPCVAAYSMGRALFHSYDGPLYQVRRADNATKDVGLLYKGGYVNASIQDDFCTGSSCTISIIYDQSGKGNHLTKAPGGSEVYGPNDDVEAVADAIPFFINGYKAYGVHVVGAPTWTSPGQVGYRNTSTNGIAKGDDPESIYMIADGTYVNGACCFNFGNAMMGPYAGGLGSMEAVYFGTNTWWSHGQGEGPWVMADLEVGVYNIGGPGNFSYTNPEGNKNNPDAASLPYPFVTAMLKGNSANATDGGPFTLKGGNAQSGPLSIFWNGEYPLNYSPMDRQGGILLGVGGDNSSGGQGNFFEGIMTTGYATVATDDAIQANIVAAGFGRETTVLPISGATFYQFSNFEGLSAKLPEGEYTLSQLQNVGIPDNSINALKIDSGLMVELFDHDNFQASLGTYSSDVADFSALSLNQKVTSIRISKNTPSSTIGGGLDFSKLGEISIQNRRVTLHLVHATQITLDIVDISGKVNQQLRKGFLLPGVHEFQIKNRPKGLCFLRLSTNHGTITRSIPW